MTGFPFKTEIMFQLMFPGQDTLFSRPGGHRITKVHIIRLAASLRTAKNATHFAVAHHGLDRTRISTAHPRNAAVLRPEDKMHRIVVLKPPGTAIVAKHSVSHHFIDVRQIPADKIDLVAQSSVKPFERRL